MPGDLPVVMLAFANDHVDDARYLRNLGKEEEAIRQALDPLVGKDIAEIFVLSNATVDRVQDAFLNPRLAGRIAVFHFGGHASGAELVLEDGEGRPASSHARGLAAFLGRQRGLELVFLNGCSTREQVERLRGEGVKAVIGTSTSIDDAVASKFAEKLYQALRSHPLGEAYAMAEAAVRNKWGDDARSVLRSEHRDLRPDAPSDAVPWPWVLDPEPARCGWRLVPASQNRNRSRNRWKVLGGTLGGVVLLGAGGWVFWERVIHPDRGNVEPRERAEPAEETTPSSLPGGSGSAPPHDLPPHSMTADTTADTTVGDHDPADAGASEATTMATTGATTNIEPEPRPTHCRIDRDYEDTWRPRCTPGQSTESRRLQGSALNRYKDGRSSVSRCDTITLYWCE